MTLPEIDVDGPRRRRRRPLLWVAAIVAVGAGVVAGIVLGGRAAQPQPEPTQAPRGAISAAQETYLLYTRWTEAVDNAACLASHGFPVEPYPASETARAPHVAAFLGVAPHKPTAWLAPAYVRNYRVLPSSFGSGDSGGPTGDPTAALAACDKPAALVDTTDSAAVATAITSALADSGFGEYLAQERWLDEHPATAALIVSRPLLGTRPAPDDGTWQGRLDRVLGYLASASSWTTDASEAYGTFAQAVGHGSDDDLVIVRVADSREMFSSVWFTGNHDPIDCGGVLVGVGMPFRDAFAAPGSASLDAIAATLDAGVCAALG